MGNLRAANQQKDGCARQSDGAALVAREKALLSLPSQESIQEKADFLAPLPWYSVS